MGWTRHVVNKNAYKIFVWKSQEKRTLGRSRHRRRWEDNMEMNLREIWCEIWDWIELANRLDFMNTITMLRIF
jgi:hypothetical protein